MAADEPTLMAPLLELPVVEAEGAPVEVVPEPEAEEEPEEVELVLLEVVALAADWKASKVLSAVGFRAKTIP